jgi:hypothetical protein
MLLAPPIAMASGLISHLLIAMYSAFARASRSAMR